MTLVRRNHGTGHSYYADGVKLPGVTRITGMAPKDALIGWAADTTASYAVDYWAELAKLRPSERLKRLQRARFEDRDTAARRGTQVHTLAEALAAGRQVKVPDHLAGHVDSYVKWLDRFQPEPMALELVVCNRAVGYCGTLDAVMILLGQTWLLELKTSRSGIFRESALQATGYARAETFTTGKDGDEHPLADLGIERCGSVHITGTEAVLRPLDSGEATWDYFRHLAALYHADEESQSWIGDIVDPPLAES